MLLLFINEIQLRALQQLLKGKFVLMQQQTGHDMHVMCIVIESNVKSQVNMLNRYLCLELSVFLL